MHNGTTITNLEKLVEKLASDEPPALSPTAGKTGAVLRVAAPSESGLGALKQGADCEKAGATEGELLAPVSQVAQRARLYLDSMNDLGNLIDLGIGVQPPDWRDEEGITDAPAELERHRY